MPPTVAATTFRCPACRVFVTPDEAGKCPQCGAAPPHTTKVTSALGAAAWQRAASESSITPLRGALYVALAGATALLFWVYGPSALDLVQNPSRRVGFDYRSGRLGMHVAFEGSWRHVKNADRSTTLFDAEFVSSEYYAGGTSETPDRGLLLASATPSASLKTQRTAQGEEAFAGYLLSGLATHWQANATIEWVKCTVEAAGLRKVARCSGTGRLGSRDRSVVGFVWQDTPERIQVALLHGAENAAESLNAAGDELMTSIDTFKAEADDGDAPSPLAGEATGGQAPTAEEAPAAEGQPSAAPVTGGEARAGALPAPTAPPEAAPVAPAATQ